MTISADLFGPIRSLTREFWNGDCLELMRGIPTGSVDMILCDLPYGTTQNKWDTVIPFEPLWREYWRVAKRNAAIVLTAAQPFTSALVMSQIDAFKYDWTWRKNQATNVFNAKKQPLRDKEDVLIFAHGTPLYNPQNLVHKPQPSRNSKTNSENWGTGKNGAYVQEFTNYPKQVLEFESVQRSIHPTQKPVALFEYLIRTYTSPGDTVLDNCAGSGTTAIAAINSDRGYICIEKDAEYYRRASERIASHA
ncbi:modification DNA-methylase protein [Rhizobium phage RHph_Y60]|nr:modification DNA-methylase protein [Rhizobium phage RHph_Y60]